MTARAKSDLVQELQRHVDASVRQRGEEYFESGRVDLEFGNEREVLASVHGDHAYAVELARTGETIEALCTCPRFAQGPGVCKHVWATLLEAGDAGYLDPPGVPPPALLERALASWTEPTPPLAESAKRRPGPDAAPGLPAPAPARTNGAAGRSSSPWRRRLALAGMWPEPEAVAAADVGGLFFVIEPSALAGNTAGFDVEVLERRRNRRGEGRPRRAKMRLDQVRALPEGPLRSALLFLDAIASATVAPPEAWRSWREDQLETRAMVPAATVPWLVPLLCAEGRCFLRAERADGRELLGPLRWDDGEPWRFHIELRRGQHDHWDVGASFRRGEQTLPAGEVVLALPAGVLFTASTAARLDHAGASRWLEFFRAEPVLQIPVGEETEFLRGVLNAPSPPLLELPAELQIAEVRTTPRPVLRVRLPAAALAKGAIPADPAFDYDGSLLPAGRASESVLDAQRRRRVYREAETERTLLARLGELGFQSDRSALPMVAMEIAPALFARAVSALLAEGWRVEAEGKPLRLSGKPKLAVKSGVDWFDLEGGVEFDGHEVPLPELLAAVRRGESFVRLGDGGVGLLPEEWLSQVAPLAGLGVEADRVRLRFQRSQVGLLDALLEGRPEATCDRLFAEVRARLRAFDGVQEAREPAGFHGELRAYQRQGLGWFRFLEEFGFGGCLADDMGLGKTVQVLALLEERRVLRAAAEQQATDTPVDEAAAAAARFPPSLAVVPKSVVQNWIAEAARFTPLLRVHNQTGPERARTAEELYQYDLIVTTYGTLRRDVPLLAETEFDYLILDEAQAVKNRDSESAKAVRLLRGRHRLALTGTPVENHLGELWSLFEFLNPGMLGSASVFRRHAADLRDLDAAEATLLSRALRPFLLRRTKEQVAHDLPPKVEQTLLCELSGAERRRYDDLREFYRHHLAKQVEERGLGKTKILVLEALLRLRQAACHSGLLDPKMAHGTSAKFELLLGELREVLAEGHKALVFSQFTSLLALLRRRLEAEGIRYAYLDGRTRDRAERVREFQEDSEIPLFLISLKAGGVGLNLTAADYVYLLDPWWNPAVEAQAVDRSHRIGQVRPVFAYRLVARDTVEERILELQQRKRKLADAILQADPGVLRSLSREDLDLLLS